MTPRLENWSVYNGRLIGYVYGHPEVEDGKHIISAQIRFLDLDASYARTSTRDYSLGEPADSDFTVCAVEDGGSDET